MKLVGGIVLSALLLGGAACGGAGDPPSPPPALAKSTEGPASRVRMPGPARARGAEAVAINRTCEQCHADIAAEWRSSLHARANVEPAYQRAFAIEPLPFCQGCHAPESDPRRPPTEEESALGVGCVTCHLTPEGVLATAGLEPGRSPSPDPRAASPHALVRSERFGGVEACESCHEFRFPTASGNHEGAFMQRTVSEHAASPARDTPCASCHMPEAPDGHRVHGFSASRDPELLARAVEVRAERTGPSSVEIRLTPMTNAHAFPTGDLFRRVEILVEAVGPELSLVGSDRTYLARHWALAEHGVGRRLTVDNRLFFEPRHLTFDLGPDAEPASIVYRVAYQRIAHPSEIDEALAALDGEVVLAQGLLAPIPHPARPPE